MVNITENFLFMRFDGSVTRVNRHHNVGAIYSITELFNSGAYSLPTYHVLCDPDQKQLCHEDGIWYDFAFISVTNAKDGSEIIFKQDISETHIISIPVGTSDMVVTKVYGNIPSGVGGQPAIWVDAFDAETGQFSDENFVEIDDEDTHAKNVTETDLANIWGYVTTVKSEILNAYSKIDANVPFVHWSRADNATLYEDNLVVNIGESGYFIVSIFQKPKPLCTSMIFCKPLTICKPAIFCKSLTLCKPAVICDPAIICKPLTLCKHSLKCIPLTIITDQCNMSIGGCLALNFEDWNPDEIIILEAIFEKYKVQTISDLAKVDLNKVEKDLSTQVSVAKVKPLIMMLKQIQKENV